MYERILVAIDASPDSPDDSLNRTTQFAKMSGGTVHLLHVARGHIIPTDIAAGARLGVRTAEDDADMRDARSCRTPSISWPPQGSTSTAR
jgi:hypothetical protein